jgi:hypothetical protein
LASYTDTEMSSNILLLFPSREPTRFFSYKFYLNFISFFLDIVNVV